MRTMRTMRTMMGAVVAAVLIGPPALLAQNVEVEARAELRVQKQVRAAQMELRRVLTQAHQVQRAAEAGRVAAVEQRGQLRRVEEARRAAALEQMQQVRRAIEAVEVQDHGQLQRAVEAAQVRRLEELRKPARIQRSGQPGSAMERGHLLRRGEVERALSARAGRAAGREPAPPPPAWLQDDPADSLYRAARAALNRGEYDASARSFRELRERFPDSGYVADSFYYEAFALHRTGAREALNRALMLLQEQARAHPGADTQRDAAALRLRIQSSLARRGDAQSLSGVRSEANGRCEDGDDSIRAVALSALVNMDAEQATPILREVLGNREACSARLREQAVFLLSRAGTEENIDVFLDLAHRNPDPNMTVREAAVHALGQTRSPEAVGALQAILASSGDVPLQENALFALSRHPRAEATEVIRAYALRADVPENLREHSIFLIGRRDDGESRAFLRSLYDRVESARAREAIVFSLARSGDDVDRRWLLERVRDESAPPQLRRTALFAVSQSGAVQVPELLSLYRTLPDREVREQVIVSLSRHGDEAAVEALMEIAREETDPGLRESAVFMLGRSSDPRVPGFLRELIRG